MFATPREATERWVCSFLTEGAAAHSGSPVFCYGRACGQWRWVEPLEVFIQNGAGGHNEIDRDKYQPASEEHNIGGILWVQPEEKRKGTCGRCPQQSQAERIVIGPPQQPQAPPQRGVRPYNM